MAGEVVDYMMGLVIMGMIFVSAVLVVPNMSYVNLLYVDQQQLRNIAQETLNTMLLDAGYPSDWGSSVSFEQDGVERFGLAYSDSSSFYVLDPDKVQRLIEDNPLGSMEYDKMRELLGLEGYGFSLRLLPPFDVAWTKNSDSDEELDFTLKVLRHDGRPIPGAVAEATMVYSTVKGDEAMIYIDYVDGVSTDLLGECEIVKTLDLQTGEELHDVIVVFEVTVADLATMIATYHKSGSEEFSQILDINTVDDDVVLTIPPKLHLNDARWVDNLIMFNVDFRRGSKATPLHNGTRSNEDKLTWGEGYEVWQRSFGGLKQSNPIIFIGSIWAVEPGVGRRSILVMGPAPNLQGNRVLRFGGDPSGPSVKVDRNVIISGMTYLVDMTFWKE